MAGFEGKKEFIVEEAGAITYRKNADKIEILLIRSKKDPSRWIFPKGHIEPGETKEMAATRELEEEAGIKGKYTAYVGMFEFIYNNNFFLVNYFLFEYINVMGHGENGREPTWYSPEKAIEILHFNDLKKLIEMAVHLIR